MAKIRYRSLNPGDLGRIEGERAAAHLVGVMEPREALALGQALTRYHSRSHTAHSRGVVESLEAVFGRAPAV